MNMSVRSKQNQPKSLSTLDETWLVIPRAFAKNKAISRLWPEQHSPSMTITLRSSQFQVELHRTVSMIPKMLPQKLCIHFYIQIYMYMKIYM